MVALSVTTGVGGCWWPIYSREILGVAPHCQLTNIAPSSASIALDSTFFIVVYSTWMFPMSGGGLWGGVGGLNFLVPPALLLYPGSDKKDLLLYMWRFIPLVL